MDTVSNVFDHVHVKLDQKIFKGDTPRTTIISYTLAGLRREIAKHFNLNAEEWIDLYLTGSLTTYQYSKSSDCDITLFPDYENWPGSLPAGQLRKLLIRIVVRYLDGTYLPGTQHPLQYFVAPVGTRPEDIYKPGMRSSWSFQDHGWFVPPDPAHSKNVAKELPELYIRAQQMAEKMKILLDTDPVAAKEFFKQIHEKRRTDETEGLGDFSEGNIIYKYLLHKGYFERLREIGVKIAAKPKKVKIPKEPLKIIYDFDRDSIFLGTVADDQPNTVIVGMYDAGDLHLNEHSNQWMNANYFKRLWHHSFPDKKFKNLYFHHDDGHTQLNHSEIAVPPKKKKSSDDFLIKFAWSNGRLGLAPVGEDKVDYLSLIEGVNLGENHAVGWFSGEEIFSHWTAGVVPTESEMRYLIERKLHPLDDDLQIRIADAMFYNRMWNAYGNLQYFNALTDCRLAAQELRDFEAPGEPLPWEEQVIAGIMDLPEVPEWEGDPQELLPRTSPQADRCPECWSPVVGRNYNHCDTCRKSVDDMSSWLPDALPEGFSKVKISAWGDIMQKAKRLIDGGQVHVLRNGWNHVVGRVQGDHGVYTTQLWKQDPQSRSISLWDCECPWNDYAWQRTRKWKKYEGRVCSHALALYWASLSTPLDEDKPLGPSGSPGGPSNEPVPPTAPYDRNAPVAPAGEQPLPGQRQILPDQQRGEIPPGMPQTFSPEPQPTDIAPTAQPRLPQRAIIPGGPNPPIMPPNTLPGQNVVPPAGMAPAAELGKGVIPGGGPALTQKSVPSTAEQTKGMTVGIPGALSSWKRASEWVMKKSAYGNGEIVRVNISCQGEDRDGQLWQIPKNSKGEVLYSNDNSTVVIFPLHKVGILQPHLVKAEVPTKTLNKANRNPFLGR